MNITATEFKLLALLASRPGEVQPRETLLRDVWGYEPTLDTRTVDTTMQRLRSKLGQAAGCVQTVRGVGYRFIASDELVAASSGDGGSDVESVSRSSSSSAS